MPAVENRVRFKNYGYALPKDDPRLVPVASAGKKQQLAHWRAAQAFADMRKAALKDGFDLRVGSALLRRSTRIEELREVLCPGIDLLLRLASRIP